MLAREDAAGDKRLVAYVRPPARDAREPEPQTLRAHLAGSLPDYMVPAAFVRARRPAAHPQRQARPQGPAGARRTRPSPARPTSRPQGEIEQTLAAIWSELLGLERVGRHDNFFELGGHSLLAVQLIERLRRRNLSADVRTLFATPTLADLAAALGGHSERRRARPTCITPERTQLTPGDAAAGRPHPGRHRPASSPARPGGLANIQDIYALSPLQEGILFHHLLAERGDPYLLISLMAFADRACLDRFLAALQQVVDRHDILRTAFLWEGLSSRCRWSGAAPLQRHRGRPRSAGRARRRAAQRPLRSAPPRASTCRAAAAALRHRASIPSTAAGCCCSCCIT